MKGKVVSFCKREIVKDFMVYPNNTAQELGKANYISRWRKYMKEQLKAKHFIEV